jgi:uncharacterized ferritin-like protein (DUF455 family)
MPAKNDKGLSSLKANQTGGREPSDGVLRHPTQHKSKLFNAFCSNCRIVHSIVWIERAAVHARFQRSTFGLQIIRISLSG